MLYRWRGWLSCVSMAGGTLTMNRWRSGRHANLESGVSILSSARVSLSASGAVSDFACLLGVRPHADGAQAGCGALEIAKIGTSVLTGSARSWTESLIDSDWSRCVEAKPRPERMRHWRTDGFCQRRYRFEPMPTNLDAS